MVCSHGAIATVIFIATNGFFTWCGCDNDTTTHCCITDQIDIFSKIEFKQASVLSSDNTNCKNDIQHFSQLFDEH